MFKKLGFIPDWWVGVEFESIGDALWWQGIVCRVGFKVDRVYQNDDGSFGVSWYIDDMGARVADLQGER